jgi:hypothetical protein
LFGSTGAFISTDTIEGFARLAAALSLLASYRIGRGGGWYRARQRVVRVVTAASRKPTASRGRGSAPEPGPLREARSRRPSLHAIVAAVWLALSLALVAYATIRGEFALAELDGFDSVATYSLGPVAPQFDESP